MSSMHQATPRIAIVGGGLAGSLLALALAQQGKAVDVYERRPDPRQQGLAAGRSINLGLSKRGMLGLSMVGLLDEVLARAVTMRGRVIHAPDGSTRYQPYGKDDSEVLHSIDRNELNLLLLERAQQHPQVRLHFEHKLVAVDKAQRRLQFEHQGQLLDVTPAWVVGADGAFSAMRRELQHGERADFHQEYLEWGYKELTLAARPDGSSVIEKTALHVWPRSHCLFVSHPNRDASHTLTLFLPFEGEDSFATVQSRDDVSRLIGKYFPDLMPLLPNLLQQWEQHPTGALLTIRCNPWRYQDWAVLVGDACHAVYPFFGQGMNSAFEDCVTLLQMLQQSNWDSGQAFAAYEQARRRHTDALCELSKRNFVELRQTVQSPWFQLRKKLDLSLNRLLPQRWLPLYTMIAHTTMPYADAWDKAKRQDRLLATLSLLVAALAGSGALWLGLGARV